MRKIQSEVHSSVACPKTWEVFAVEQWKLHTNSKNPYMYVKKRVIRFALIPRGSEQEWGEDPIISSRGDVT